MFLKNDLAEGRYRVHGEPVTIEDIKVPIFSVGTETDHVAPWRSVFKIHLLTDAEVTFVLTSGGHNAGIVSEPGHPHRSFRIATREQGGAHRDPERWHEETPATEGSWWPKWDIWLANHSGERVAPPPMGASEGLSAAGSCAWNLCAQAMSQLTTLDGKKGLVIGIANEHSIAYGCADVPPYGCGVGRHLS